MTFEEWAQRYSASAQSAWEAAVTAERERCARIVLSAKRTTGPAIDPDDEADALCLEIAESIRCNQR